MRSSRKVVGDVRRKFRRSPLRDGYSNTSPSIYDEYMDDEELPLSEFSYDTVQSSALSIWNAEVTLEDIAAVKIQAAFRGHIARRAYRALRSLIKFQALVRGVCVRRQARIALRCMHALARLQVRVRTRQLLSRCSDE